MTTKTTLTQEELESQFALELPERNMLRALVVVFLKTGDIIEIEVEDVNVGAALCTAILANQEFGANACRVDVG